MSVYAHQASSAYRQVEAQTRTPIELVVMLYDGALRFISQARDAVERRNIPARREALSRALAILTELQGTLNKEEGGEIAQSLSALYVYINGRLVEAAARQQTAPLDEASHLLSMLRSAWADIAHQAPAGSAPR
jgi:flagellar secretion chaperone FliS